jgi:hypothetical protein
VAYWSAVLDRELSLYGYLLRFAGIHYLLAVNPLFPYALLWCISIDTLACLYKEKIKKEIDTFGSTQSFCKLFHFSNLRERMPISDVGNILVRSTFYSLFG